MGMIQKNKGLSIAQQKYLLEKAFPNSKVSITGHNKIVWNYKLKPTALSSWYNVRLVYDGRTTDVYIVQPNPLQKAKGETKLPHVYDQKKQKLCLYWKDWNKTLSLSKTVVPWIADWLFYYEIWLYTGVWEGGGIHPIIKTPYIKNKSQSNIIKQSFPKA